MIITKKSLENEPAYQLGIFVSKMMKKNKIPVTEMVELLKLTIKAIKREQ